MAVTPPAILMLETGQVQVLTARVLDGRGATVPGIEVTWSVSDPGVATVDAGTGRVVAVAVAAGTTEVTAAAGEVDGTAVVEVYLPPERAFTEGASYFGRRDYVEYVVGTLPIVISAPHGGDVEPPEIGLRTYGVTGQDRRTLETAREIRTALEDRLGGTPHVVLNRLHRNRLDANREVMEAAQGNPFSEYAWSEYHEFIDSAKARAVPLGGRALFIDLHGHGHVEQRIELGYLLSAADLNGSDAALDELAKKSSIRGLAAGTGERFSALIRGPRSLGAELVARGVRAVPGPAEPGPGAEPYFTGGYNTVRHGSRDGGPVDAVQFELNWNGIRETSEDRNAFADALAGVLQSYLAEYYGITLIGALTTAPDGISK